MSEAQAPELSLEDQVAQLSARLAGADALINDLVQVLGIYANPTNYEQGLNHTVAQEFIDDLIAKNILIPSTPQAPESANDSNVIDVTPVDIQPGNETIN